MKRRTVLGASIIGTTALVPKYSWLSAISTDAHAVAPLVVMAAVQTAITAIKAFSDPGTGALGPMLSAILQNQQIIIDQLQQVLTSLNALSKFVVNAAAELPVYLEQSRLQGYFDELLSSGSSFREYLESEKTASSATEKAMLTAQYRILRQNVFQTRNKLQIYSNIYASVSIPLAVALEVALDYKTGFNSLVPIALRSYIQWCGRVKDTTVPNSVASQLKTLAAEHSAIDAQIANTSYGRAHGSAPGFTVSEGCYQSTACMTKSECHFVPNPRNTKADQIQSTYVKYRTDPDDLFEQFADMSCSSTEILGPTVALNLTNTVAESIDVNGVRILSVTPKVDPAFTATCPNPNRNDCYPPPATTVAAQTAWIQGSREFQAYGRDAQAFSALIDQLNSKRIEMAAHLNALVINQQALDKATKQLRLIGGL